jgi:hypothetical protein
MAPFGLNYVDCRWCYETGGEGVAASFMLFAARILMSAFLMPSKPIKVQPIRALDGLSSTHPTSLPSDAITLS